MFDKLDEDGGGTLDCGEICALFSENGIHMSKEQVANMFSEALRMDAMAEYRKHVQNGSQSRADYNATIKKSTQRNLQLSMNSTTWKQVTKSPAALKSKVFCHNFYV